MSMLLEYHSSKITVMMYQNNAIEIFRSDWSKWILGSDRKTYCAFLGIENEWQLIIKIPILTWPTHFNFHAIRLPRHFKLLLPSSVAYVTSKRKHVIHLSSNACGILCTDQVVLHVLFLSSIGLMMLLTHVFILTIYVIKIRHLKVCVMKKLSQILFSPPPGLCLFIGSKNISHIHPSPRVV